MRSSDWSSDVCSSDLGNYLDAGSEGGLPFSATLGVEHCPHCGAPGNGDGRHGALRPIAAGAPFLMSQITPGLLSNLSRSDERRVGKECFSTFRSRWSPSPKQTTGQQETIVNNN